MADISLLNEQKKQRKELIFYKTGFVIALFIIAILFSLKFSQKLANLTEKRETSKKIPHYAEVIKIIRPLKYSGLQAIVKPEVHITLDYDSQVWTIHNIHSFDKEGHIVLQDDRYGLCGDLAGYVHRKISPLFGDNYSIQFAKVGESGYFLAPRDSHVALLIKEKKDENTDNTFIIDPSFGRYGYLEEFDNYLIFATADNLVFETEKLRDITFQVGDAIPILIKNNFMLTLSIEQVKKKFDKDNFALAITATKRYKFSGRYVIVFMKREGKIETYENKWLLETIINQDEYLSLRNKISGIFEKLQQE